VRIDVSHPSLTAGDACPARGQGTVHDKTPGVLVRILGQPPLAAKVDELQKPRRNLCGQAFTTAEPEEAGDRKYDSTARPMPGVGSLTSMIASPRSAAIRLNRWPWLTATMRWRENVNCLPRTVCGSTRRRAGQRWRHSGMDSSGNWGESEWNRIQRSAVRAGPIESIAFGEGNNTRD